MTIDEWFQHRISTLEQAIRTHRDARGDDRCWMDDEALYGVLPEGYTPPVRDTTVELSLCKQFIKSRRHPATVYVSPEREIERLQGALKAAEVREQNLTVERDALRIALDAARQALAL